MIFIKQRHVLIFFLFLLIAIPITVLSLQTSKEIRGRAQKNTGLFPFSTTDSACGIVTILGSAMPAGIMDVGSEIWAASYGNGAIVRIRPNGVQDKPPITSLDLYTPLNFLKVGSMIWVIDASGYILRFNPDGSQNGDPIDLPQGSTDNYYSAVPTDALDMDGEIWVSDPINDRILRFDVNGTISAPPITFEKGTTPTTMSKVNNNDIWVLSLNESDETSRILRLDKSGALTDTVTNPALKIAIDIITVGDEIWVSNYDFTNEKGGILRFAKNGDLLADTAASAIYVPVGFANVNGSIWITEPGGDYSTPGRVYVFNPDGTLHTCDKPLSSLSVSVALDAIGSAGDATNPFVHEFSNKNPQASKRELIFVVHDNEDNPVSHGLGTLSYNKSLGVFEGNVPLEIPIESGSYTADINMSGYLRKKVDLAITEGTTYEVAKIVMRAGDVNSDNLLNILDYNVLHACGYGAIKRLPKSDYKSRYNSTQCYDFYPDNEYTDLNDDGYVDQVDFNIFLRELPHALTE